MIYKQKWYFCILKVSFIFVFSALITICEAKDVCKNLSKVNNIDELLFQFYSNIDNQCLFEMSTEELEKIWGIRVLDYTNASSDKLNELNKEVKKIRKNEEGIFVKKVDFESNISAFDIHLTDKYININQGWGGAIGKGQFPELLPNPKVINKPFDTKARPFIDGNEPIIPKDTVYQKYSNYYWINKVEVENQPVLFFKTDFSPIPTKITLYSQSLILKFK